jgi:energy-coupling factor transport system substrate-specific component
MSGSARGNAPAPGGVPARQDAPARECAPVPRRGAYAVLEAAALIAPAAAMGACAAAGIEQTALLTLVVVLAALALFFAVYEHRRPRLRETMPVAVLAALAAAGRILFAPFPDVKPVSAIAIVAGVAFGRQSGFMVGALAALVSNFFFGQGPWTPWQMYAWGLVGYGAGLLAYSRLFERTAGVCAYGFAACLGYGFILNLWSILGFFHPQTASEALAVYAAALPFDIAHGIATVAFLLILYAPWRRKIARVKVKYGL